MVNLAKSRGKFDPSQDQRAIVASKQLNEPNQAMFNTSGGKNFQVEKKGVFPVNRPFRLQ